MVLKVAELILWEFNKFDEKILHLFLHLVRVFRLHQKGRSINGTDICSFDIAPIFTYSVTYNPKFAL